MPTALEIAQVSNNEFLAHVFNFTRKATPFFNALDVSEFEGLHFKALAMETASDEPTFVNLGEGYIPRASQYTVRQFSAARINHHTKVQKSTADVWNKENKAINGDYKVLQQLENIKSAFLRVEKVLIRGTTYDSKGFPGMKQLTPALTSNTLVYNTTAPEDYGFRRSFINAGGSAANTATSIYFIVDGPLDVQMKMGGPTGLAGFLKPTPWMNVYIEATDPVDSVIKGDYFYVSSGDGYTGLSVAGANETGTVRVQQSLRRIGNITNEAGYKVTEALLDYGLESFPPEKKPNHILMSHRSVRQYRDSKPAATIFLAGGGDAKNAVVTQPLPDNHRGIPFIVSENVPNTDAIEVPT